MRTQCSVLLLLLLSACSRDAGSARANGDSRRWVRVAFDTVWTVGGNAADTVLSYPAHLASLDDLVIVSDPGAHRLVALRSSTGAIAWINGPERGHKFASPLFVWPQPGHRIGVVDEETHRLTSVDTGGRTVSETDVNPLRVLNGVCALNGKDALAASSDELGPLYSLAADGKTTRPIELTIPGTKGRDPLVLQSSLASNRDGTACVVAMAFGNGLSLWNGAAFTRVARYREDIAFPVPIMNTRMQMTPTGERKVTFPTMPHRAIESALGVAMVPGRVRVLFEGGTANKGRIIDDYDDRTLEYLGSILLPTPVTEFTAPTSDMIVMVAKRNGFPMLVALRQRPEPAQ